MQQALVQASQNSQTKRYGKHSQEYRHSEQKFIEAWRELQSARKIPFDWHVNGTDYQLWRARLSDLTNRQLDCGVTAADGFHGFFDRAAFRKLCLEQSLAESQQSRQAQQPTTARLDKPSTLGNKRFAELHKVTMAMMAEDENGAITKATDAGDLNLRFVRGKSAEEIIEFCNRKYG